MTHSNKQLCVPKHLQKERWLSHISRSLDTSGTWREAVAGPTPSGQGHCLALLASGKGTNRPCPAERCQGTCSFLPENKCPFSSRFPDETSVECLRKTNGKQQLGRWAVHTCTLCIFVLWGEEYSGGGFCKVFSFRGLECLPFVQELSKLPFVFLGSQS